MDRYRLAPLRDQRDRDERTERGALAGVVADARSTAASVERARARTSAAREAAAGALRTRDELAARGTASALLALADRHAARRRRDLDDALDEERRARAAHAGRLAAVDDARDRLAAARARREVIERHFARWREQQRRLAERRADD